MPIDMIANSYSHFNMQTFQYLNKEACENSTARPITLPET